MTCTEDTLSHLGPFSCQTHGRDLLRTFKPLVLIMKFRSILHDEKQYPDPFTFTPDRFLTSDGQLDPAVQDPELAAFGYGRRKW